MIENRTSQEIIKELKESRILYQKSGKPLPLFNFPWLIPEATRIIHYLITSEKDETEKIRKWLDYQEN